MFKNIGHIFMVLQINSQNNCLVATVISNGLFCIFIILTGFTLN